MDQFLISQTPDSLNKPRIVQTGWRLALFTGVFVFLGGGPVRKCPPHSLLLVEIDWVISDLKWQPLIPFLISWEIHGSV